MSRLNVWRLMKFYNPAVRLDLQPVGRNSKLDDVRVFTLVHQRISYSESGAYPDHSRVKWIPQRMGEFLAGPSTTTKQADQNKHTRLSVATADNGYRHAKSVMLRPITKISPR
jgi:hypothetical protein